MTEVKRIFTVNGKPFYPLGCESLYVAGYSVRNAAETDEAFKAVIEAHCNTSMIDIYWDQLNPKEGEYDFSSLDILIAGARRHNLKLILLWFATWKNGNMDYTPAWVKANPRKFKRVKSPTGKELWSLSPHCKANLDADKKAFAALCAHLKAKDSTEQTVIGIQVQNEPGILGSDRDYGPEAQAIFESPVPAKLVTAMKKRGKGPVFESWQQAGGKASGNWQKLFGWEGGEFMTAWGIASYINGVAEAGKAVYDIPMYINAWQSGQNWWPLPGESYPSGGAVIKVLDIYKWYTPHIDLIAPDNYQDNLRAFESVCSAYSRDDNPLFVPESVLKGPNKLRAIADYDAIGYFGEIRTLLGKDGAPDPESQTQKDICRCISAVIPLLLKYQGTGKVRSVIQEENMTKQLFDFDGYMGMVQYGPLMKFLYTEKRAPSSPGGWGLIFQASRNEFYLIGDNFQLYLRPKPTIGKMQPPLLSGDWRNTSLGNFISVEEGHFDKNGKFIMERKRNGDQVTWCGLWVEPSAGVVRAITCD
jgi:hypothetical protein